MVARQGGDSDAAQFLAEALALNPFVVPIPLTSKILDAQLPEPPAIKEVQTLWYGNLAKVANLQEQNLVRRQLRSLRRVPSGPFQNEPIHSVSFGGSHLVVSWGLGEHPNYISALDLETGRGLWNRTLAGDRLRFATPRLVVCQRDDKSRTFRLFDLQTGGHLRDMDRDYFETVFCPDNDQLSNSHNYGISNVDMEVNTVPLKERIGTMSGEYKEERRLFDPFGSFSHYAIAENFWRGNAEGFGWRPDHRVAMIGVNRLVRAD